MALPFNLRRPLLLRSRNGEKTISAELFAHPQGIVWFELYWHLAPNPNDKIHLLRGDLKGEGPWIIADTVISLVGCQGTDPEMAMQLSQWESYLLLNKTEYPGIETITQIAKQWGVNRD